MHLVSGGIKYAERVRYYGVCSSINVRATMHAKAIEPDVPR